ncbi:MAG TPA: hypothetical protein VJV22_09895, partial [Acidobacteriaceae bacterium]|nr:hypothetical protein [Acidobacteriaceae bacterium]
MGIHTQKRPARFPAALVRTGQYTEAARGRHEIVLVDETRSGPDSRIQTFSHRRFWYKEWTGPGHPTSNRIGGPMTLLLVQIATVMLVTLACGWLALRLGQSR